MYTSISSVSTRIHIQQYEDAGGILSYLKYEDAGDILSYLKYEHTF
jgi:hypothetical protein